MRFTSRSTERYADWATSAPVLQRRAVEAALFTVTEGTWRDRYDWVQDVTHGLTVHVHVVDDVWLTIRFATEYPDFVQLIHVGHLDP